MRFIKLSTSRRRGGIRTIDSATGYEIYGAIDDVWKHRESGELIVVDYKSTSKKEEPTLERGFGDSYKRQIEIYQWLLIQNGFRVSKSAYFLYVNGIKSGSFFVDSLIGSMRFSAMLIEYSGDASWVPSVVAEAISCLHAKHPPESGESCDSCRYFDQRVAVL
jgi:hypothetical protein